MNTIESRKYEMLVRVRDFGEAYAARFPESTLAKPLFAKVASAVTDLQANDMRAALQKLDVLDQISGKTKIVGTVGAAAELVGKDEAEICIFYRNEMSANPNVDVVGTLPAEFAPPTNIVAFISTHARDAKAAKALVDDLASRQSEAVYEQDGLVPGP